MTRAMKSLQELKLAEIPAKIQDLRKEYLVLKAQSATGTPPKNPMQLRNIRRAIARLHTLGTQQSGKTASLSTPLSTPKSVSDKHHQAAPAAAKEAKKPQLQSRGN
ncbi:50S ribosomal protein L29 [Candidatus Woesearchaeota archaeon]|nr:50S ribosomal protein L29 [Candidatus Woesearchaeota archaeon]